jgi:hypothetical protein
MPRGSFCLQVPERPTIPYFRSPSGFLLFSYRWTLARRCRPVASRMCTLALGRLGLDPVVAKVTTRRETDTAPTSVPGRAV